MLSEVLLWYAPKCEVRGCPTVALLHQGVTGASKGATNQKLKALFNREIFAKYDNAMLMLNTLLESSIYFSLTSKYMIIVVMLGYYVLTLSTVHLKFSWCPISWGTSFKIFNKTFSRKQRLNLQNFMPFALLFDQWFKVRHCLSVLFSVFRTWSGGETSVPSLSAASTLLAVQILTTPYIV